MDKLMLGTGNHTQLLRKWIFKPRLNRGRTLDQMESGEEDDDNDDNDDNDYNDDVLVCWEGAWDTYVGVEV